MLDAPARGHPLSVAGMDHASISGAVAMLDRPLNNECNRLDAEMWVKGKAARRGPIFSHPYEGIAEDGVWHVDQAAGAMSVDLS
jgi:hypothetical protein